MAVQEADELDPFRGSVISDDSDGEAALESPGTQTHMRDGGEGGKKKKKEVYLSFWCRW